MNNKQLFAYLFVLVCLMGCTSAPAQIKPIKANAEIYKKEDCEKISWRAQDVSSCLNSQS